MGSKSTRYSVKEEPIIRPPKNKILDTIIFPAPGILGMISKRPNIITVYSQNSIEMVRVNPIMKLREFKTKFAVQIGDKRENFNFVIDGEKLLDEKLDE
jgi:hypothetical protein